MFQERYKEQIYAGVLGKILGVYLGRPVEGWSYDKIVEKLGTVSYYVNEKTGAPLIVPDDDISGTFAFFQALKDNGCNPNITAKEIGNSWLNYIIENETILWWGGLARSTEHTAFLRLKEGIDAPESGSSLLNGESMATQIGAQIFIDAWALVNPGNPDRATYMAREAARVSHDGIAVEAAVYLAAMEAMAFDEKRTDVLLDNALIYVKSDLLLSLVEAIRNLCSKATHWTDVRSYIAENHGYDKYLGNCPMVTNHLAVLMAYIMGGDSFQESISIATSAGWDTDCNAGNVGCLNGIRLGLAGINNGADFRTPVADRMLVVTSDGGSCISDAVIESRKIIEVAAQLDNVNTKISPNRFSFEFPGSTQGFYIPERSSLTQAVKSIENASDRLSGNSAHGLLIHYKGLAPGTQGCVCVDTFTDLQPKGIEGTSYFEVSASPTLYTGQRVEAYIETFSPMNPSCALYIQYYNHTNRLEWAQSNSKPLEKGENTISWEMPDTKGFPIYRIGIILTSDVRLDGSVNLVSLDWSNTPKTFHMARSYEMDSTITPWTTETTWLKSFMSSASNFNPDYTTTFSLSHMDTNGVVTLGTADWTNYSIASQIQFMQHQGAGLVVRSVGHKRYYAALIQGSSAKIVKVKDRDTFVLAESNRGYNIDESHRIEFTCQGTELTMKVDGEQVLSCNDNEYVCGGAGFVVHRGAVLIDRFTITSEKEDMCE